MDTHAVAAVGLQLKAVGESLAQIVSTVDQLASSAVHLWEGQDSEEFLGQWHHNLRPRLAASSAAIAGLGQSALNNVTEQERASDEGIGTAEAIAALGLAAAGGQGVKGPPAAGASPATNARWWNSLSRAQQEWVVANNPRWIGNRDGIPAWARDRANRSLIDTYRAELEQRMQGANARERKILQAKLAGLNKVGAVIGLPGRQLLLLDIERSEQLLAAMAIGDVDAADHVAVFTPGLSTTVAGSLADTDRNMAELRQRMQVEALRNGSGTVAVVSWLGYEAPQWSGTFDWHDSVGSDSLAREGSMALASFYNGLDAMRGPDAHITALGHSYGSTTTGLALQQPTGVDDVVFFGSPGVGTSSVGDLLIPSGHAYYIESMTDPVGDLGRFGADPSTLAGIHQLSADASYQDGVSRRASFGHSQYLSDNSTSQFGIASVAVGDGQGAVGSYLPDTDPYRLRRFGAGAQVAAGLGHLVAGGADAVGHGVHLVAESAQDLGAGVAREARDAAEGVNETLSDLGDRIWKK